MARHTMSWVGRLSMVNMTILTQVICMFNAIPVNIPTRLSYAYANLF